MATAELEGDLSGGGLQDVRAFIAGGNVLFRASFDAARVKAVLQERLLAPAGSPVCIAPRPAAGIAANSGSAKSLSNTAPASPDRDF